jgi:hypothetical protein
MYLGVFQMKRKNMDLKEGVRIQTNLQPHQEILTFQRHLGQN